MEKALIATIIIIAMCLPVTGCDGPPPTPTPLPTSTPTPDLPPTSTPMPIPTDTPIPTSTHTPLPTLTPTSTPTPALTDTPIPTYTHTPTSTPTLTPSPTLTPTPFPTPSVEHLLLADFQTFFYMGAASPGDKPDNFLVDEYVQEGGTANIVVKLNYETPDAWAAFWRGLQGADFTPFDTLTFFAKGDPERGIPSAIKLELKRDGDSRVSVHYLAGLTEEWQHFAVSLDAFRPPPGSPPLCGWDEMSQLVFTFESKRAGKQGTVYLDDVYVERRGDGAPTPEPQCFPTATPTPSPTLTPTITPTPEPEASPVPTDTPTPIRTPTPSPFIVADFNSCSGVNNLGGPMGAAYNTPDQLMERYVEEPARGCVARLEYQIQQWAAFWMKLQGTDLTPYSRLVFDIRADETAPQELKIELKRASNTEVSIKYVSGITTDWQTTSVNLGDFGPTGYTAPLSAYTEMEELVFTFEANRSGTAGIVYLDNVAFGQ